MAKYIIEIAPSRYVLHYNNFITIKHLLLINECILNYYSRDAVVVQNVNVIINLRLWSNQIESASYDYATHVTVIKKC